MSSPSEAAFQMKVCLLPHLAKQHTQQQTQLVNTHSYKSLRGASYLQGVRSGEPALISKHLGLASSSGTGTPPACWGPPGSYPSRLWGGVVLMQASML